MVFDISKVGGIGKFAVAAKKLGEGADAEDVEIYSVVGTEADGASSGAGKVFLVVRKNTLEVRTDGKLNKLLREKYESVMESRYFGRGGIEIVNAGQLSEDEICDLVRLSYQLSSAE